MEWQLLACDFGFCPAQWLQIRCHEISLENDLGRPAKNARKAGLQWQRWALRSVAFLQGMGFLIGAGCQRARERLHWL